MRIIGFLILVILVITSYIIGQFSFIYKLTKCSQERFITVFYDLIKMRKDIVIKTDDEEEGE